MRRRVLLRTIARAARDRGVDWHLEREGGNHSVFVLDGRRIPVPRHTEINELTCRGILRQCESSLGEDWWR